MGEVLTDERDLWSRALQRDEHAFARLFDAHQGVVLRQALRLIDRPADAEEVAAAAFFELWRRRAAVRLVDGSVLPWLLVTTTNLARNRRRALLRRDAALARLPRPEERGAEAFERIDADVPRTALAAALRTLRPADAALLTLTALDGYALGEVADLLGISAGAARVRLHRVRTRLRGLLDDRARTMEEER